MTLKLVIIKEAAFLYKNIQLRIRIRLGKSEVFQLIYQMKFRRIPVKIIDNLAESGSLERQNKSGIKRFEFRGHPILAAADVSYCCT